MELKKNDTGLIVRVRCRFSYLSDQKLTPSLTQPRNYSDHNDTANDGYVLFLNENL